MSSSLLASGADETPQRVTVASFSTQTLERRHRYEAWRSLMASTHEIEADPAAFSGAVRSVHLGRMLLHRMDASPQQVQRTSHRIRRDGLEHFVLHLSSQDGAAETPDASVSLKGGTVSVNDLTRPSLRAAMPEHGSIIVSLSRDLVGEALGSTDGLHGLVLDSEAGRLFADYLRTLVARADQISLDAAPGIARATAYLLAASVTERAGLIGRVNGDGVGLLRAKRFIEAQLASPDLSPEQIAAAAAVSRASLFRMFRPLGGVTFYVQKRRLDRVRACLIDPADARPLSILAYRHGFASPSHFSRAFRERFGCTPGEMRKHRPPLGPDPDIAEHGESFAAWVRGLG